jgi:hypothetical protein
MEDAVVVRTASRNVPAILGDLGNAKSADISRGNSALIAFRHCRRR